MGTVLSISTEPQWPHYADQLHQYFCDRARGRCLLWVNPAQGDPFDGLDAVQKRRVQVRINHPRFDARLGPYLAPLDLEGGDDAAIFRTSVEMAWNAWSDAALTGRSGQPIAGWVVTDDDPRWLAHYWASRCHLHRVDGQSWLLRFHDPGVREWLWEILKADQRAALLGSALTLVGFDRTRQLMYHEAPQPMRELAESQQRLLLDRSQWQDVSAFATVHSAWLQWIGLPPARGKPIPARWQHEVIAALSHAETYGIVDEPDRQLFALHALLISGEFHRNPKLAPVWNKTLAGEFYGSALEETLGPPHQLHEFL